MARLLSTMIFWLLVAGLLWYPVDQALVDQALVYPGQGGLRAHNLTAVAVLVALLAILGSTVGSRWILCAILPILIGLAFVRILYYGLIQFSGAGFTDEFFFHLEWESVRLAVQEYDRLFRRLLIAIGLVVLAALALWRPVSSRRPAVLLPAVAVGLAVLVVVRAGMPEWQLYEGWRNWRLPPRVEVDRSELDHWRRSGFVETEIRDKRHLRVEIPGQPTNLVLLYLESIGVNLADQPQWPDLMPRFKELLAGYAWVDHVHTSSYITIEGITNSQCGTLFPFNRGSDSLAGGDGLAEYLPCLGDVLQAGGYRQIYLGGAEMRFAGKDDFLAAHGYDVLKGMEHWRDQGFRQRPGKWGLSDAELFDQSIEEIRRLREADEPFNLTLLTIGTHLPGYLYRECEPYPGGDDPFLQALHCTDQLLGRWVRQLEEDGVFDDTLVVITADHHVFANPDMKRLFGEDIEDRRLPLIVLGPEIPPAAVGEGALYDLAPTLLDLLGIRHNARFALGRSLLKPQADRDYFFKRYADIRRSERISNPPAECPPKQGRSRARPQLPLDSCEKARLLSVLEALNSAYGHPTRLDCSREPALLIRVPPAGEPLEFVVDGEDQAGRFTHRARTVEPTRAGVFIVVFDVAGRVLGRLVIQDPASGLPDETADLLTLDDARHALVVWRLDPAGPFPFPEIPSPPDLAGTPAVWLADLDAPGILLDRAAEAPGEEVEFALAGEQCAQWFVTGD